MITLGDEVHCTVAPRPHPAPGGAAAPGDPAGRARRSTGHDSAMQATTSGQVSATRAIPSA